MRLENTSCEKGRDARNGGLCVAVRANRKWCWALAVRSGKKNRREREEVFVGQGLLQNLQDRQKAPRSNLQLKGHTIPFTFSICDVTLRAKLCTLSPATLERKQELGRCSTNRKRWPFSPPLSAYQREREIKVFSRQISQFPSIPVFFPEVRERNTLHNPVAPACRRL